MKPITLQQIIGIGIMVPIILLSWSKNFEPTRFLQSCGWLMALYWFIGYQVQIENLTTINSRLKSVLKQVKQLKKEG